ncbi:MAG TPA: hypothetical protein VJ161_11310, partial [Geobacteraceae bacterium]|nr:hypothetical protein [Geobacteraceae bacterium]
ICFADNILSFAIKTELCAAALYHFADWNATRPFRTGLSDTCPEKKCPLDKKAWLPSGKHTSRVGLGLPMSEQ